jgi:hypothetical protein
MVISSLPNLITAWYSALYCPSNHSDINANVIKNRRKKHLMRAQEFMLLNISIGYEIAWENSDIKKRRIPSGFYRLGLLYLFINLPNIKCNSIASVPLLAPTWAWTSGPSAHINTLEASPSKLVTHRSTKAAALAEQGEPLLQGLRVSDVTDWNAISAHHR